MRREKGEEQALTFLYIVFSSKKNDLQNLAETSITRSRTLSSQIPITDVGAMLFGIGTRTLGFVLELTVLVCLQRTCSFKRTKILGRGNAATELSPSFVNLQQFSSVRLAKSLPLLNCCGLEFVAPLHGSFAKVSLYFKHWISSSPTPMCFENIFHWIREGHYSTKYNPKIEAVYYNDQFSNT